MKRAEPFRDDGDGDGFHKRRRDSDGGRRHSGDFGDRGDDDFGDRGGGGFRGRGGGRGRGRDGGGEGGGFDGGDDGGGRGGGRGRGRGRGRGGRPFRDRRQETLDSFDLVPTRPTDMKSKQGSFGTKVELLVNYFMVRKKPKWNIYQYRVDFEPLEERTHIKKQLFRRIRDVIGEYIFDGGSLFVTHPLNEPLEHTIQEASSPTGEYKIIIKMVATVEPTDPHFIQFFNIIVRKCLSALDLDELGRHFYDRTAVVQIPAHRLEVWPGYKTAIRQHEKDVMLCVELAHKVLRKDSCLDVIRNITRYRNGDAQNAIKRELVGTIVMAKYSRKTYRVDDIEWAQTPADTFETMEGPKSFADYFREKYGMTIRDMEQPLLLSRPKKKDFHRGMNKPILLVPELCNMTGLSDDMRNNFQLMKELGFHLHVEPEKRADGIRNFMRRLRANDIVRELDQWGLAFEGDLTRTEGRQIPFDDIIFGDGRRVDKNDRNFSEKGDFTNSFRSERVYRSVALDKYVIICSQADASYVDAFVDTLLRVTRPINFPIQRPMEVMQLRSRSSHEFSDAVNQAMQRCPQLQMIVVVLPDSKLELYSAVKKRCYLENGVSSQCIQAKTLKNGKRLMSVCTKLSLQMLAKLGGAPWGSSLPMKGVMVVGFDVHHAGAGKRKCSYGAIIATTSNDLTRYYSAVSKHLSREELSHNLCTNITKCLRAYYHQNDSLPMRIFWYRDGVGDGQLKYVYNTELEQIKSAINSVYSEASAEMPRMTMTVVTKRINTRVMLIDQYDHGRIKNPRPGTIVDSVITLPERYDFFLVAQHPLKGTASPTNYNVLYDTSGLDPDKIQRFTFKLTSMYFNYTGPVAVPAPCQYAHKLAFLTGTALGDECHERLCDKLYFL